MVDCLVCGKEIINNPKQKISEHIKGEPVLLTICSDCVIKNDK